MNTYGYIRVSTQEQEKEGISLENQAEKIKAYAKLKDLGEIEIISDPGKSGKNLNRPGIQELKRLVEVGVVRAVIVYKLDRLSRKVTDTLELIELFKSKDAVFHSINETIDTKTAMGTFFLNITASLAQMERDLIAERTSDALEYKKQKGEWLGTAPIGYQYDKKSKKLIENESEMKIIQKAKRLRRRGWSYENISKHINIAKPTVYKLINCNMKRYKARYSKALA